MRQDPRRPLLERSYYAQQRDDVAEFIHAAPGRSVLDVGCGEGGLGRMLKQKGCRPVVGIEIDPSAAAVAARHYDRVYTADMDAFDPPLDKQCFDHIVCADILEHLQNPWAVLARLRPFLKPDGTMVASIPNIGNIETIAQLLQGRFDYVDWGVMDWTHLRFFTRCGIEAMFGGAGYMVQSIRPKCHPDADRILDLWRRNDLDRRIGDLVVLMGGGKFAPTDQDLRQMLAIQYLVVAVGAA